MTPFARLHTTLVSSSVRTDFEAETLAFTRPGGTAFNLACQVFDAARVIDRAEDVGATSTPRLSVVVSSSEYLAAAGVVPEYGTKISRGGITFTVWRITDDGHFATLEADGLSPEDTRADGSQTWGDR